MTGLWLGQAFGVFLLPGFGVGSSSPQVPRHPTSMCDTGVNLDDSKKRWFYNPENGKFIIVSKLCLYLNKTCRL